MDTKYLEIIKAPVITEKSGVIAQNMFSKLILELIK